PSPARASVASEAAEDGPAVIVMHLPDWESVYKSAVYARSMPALLRATGERPVFDAVSFEGGTESVTAQYAQGRLVIFEFTTPQYASDSDARVGERIAQLKDAGQPTPSSYKRIGNYGVFVFDAPDAAAAEKLISEVKYEKDVRWLGRNPHAAEIATREYTSTMGNVILTSLLTTGAAILLCLGLGGVLGGAVFMYRRSRNGAQEAYSDAGGMLRLNLEEVNPRINPSNLLGSDEK
ncbi:MAG: hypothetical protein WCD76_09585, partial [Pyrinomonadaceae bacterium]